MATVALKMSDPPPGPFRPRYSNDHPAGLGGDRSDRPHLPSFNFMRNLASGQAAAGQGAVGPTASPSPQAPSALLQQSHHGPSAEHGRLSQSSTSSRTHEVQHQQQPRGSASPRYAGIAAPHTSRPTMIEARTLPPITSEQGNGEGQGRLSNFAQPSDNNGFHSPLPSMMEGPWRGSQGYAGGSATSPPKGPPGPSGSSHPSSPNAHRQPQVSARKRGHDESFQTSLPHDSPYQHSIPLSQGSDAGSSRSHHSNPLPSYYPPPLYGAVAPAPPSHIDSSRTSLPRPPQAPGAPGDETQDSMSDQYDLGGSRKVAKINVRVACSNCKKAHLACDTNRPCGRCVRICKTDSCVDVQHKKRGRPRSDRRITLAKSETPPLPTGQQPFTTRERDLASPPSSTANAPSRSAAASAPAAPPPPESSASSPADHHHHHHHEPPFHPNWPRNLPGPPLDAARVPRRDTDSSSRSSQFSGGGRNEMVQMGPPAMPLSQMPAGLHPHAPQPVTTGMMMPVPTPGMTTHTGPRPSPMLNPASPRWRQPEYALMGPAVNLSPVVTMICSTALTCARLSENSPALLGYVPGELTNRALVEIVHPEDVNRVRGMWQKLIESVQVRVQPMLSVSAEEIMAIDPNLLIQPALGTSFPEDNVRIRLSNGLFDFYSLRIHIGGYFGADLAVSHSRERAYIVASLLKLGNDGNHPQLHSMIRGGGGGGGNSSSSSGGGGGGTGAQPLSPRSNGSVPTSMLPSSSRAGNAREGPVPGATPRPRSLVPN